MTLRNLAATLIASLLVICLPNVALGQASTIVSERDPIVVYDEEDLNPIRPRYEWIGPTLLRNIRVIDGMGNAPAEGQDILVAGGMIQSVGPTGSLDVPADARVIDGTGLTALPGLIDAHMHLQGGWRGGNDNGPRPAWCPSEEGLAVELVRPRQVVWGERIVIALDQAR